MTMSTTAQLFDSYTGSLSDRDLLEAAKLAGEHDPGTAAELRELLETEGHDPAGLWDLFVDHDVVDPDPATPEDVPGAEDPTDDIARELTREDEPGDEGTESDGRSDQQRAVNGPPTIAQRNPVRHPGVYVITGHRGSGKTMLAYRLGEVMSPAKHVLPVTVGLPEAVHNEFPDEWYHVETIDDAPHESVCIIDEAYAQYHARTAFDSENIDMASVVNQSRHTGRTILFVSQSTSHLDKTAITESDGLLMKEPGQFHGEFERRQLRSMLDEAEEAFASMSEDENPKAYTYVISDHFTGLMRNELPSFHSERLSRAYGRQE